MPTKNETDTLATIASIASDLRKISTAMSACADKIDDVALQVEERINDAGQAAAQLQQLKAILKGI